MIKPISTGESRAKQTVKTVVKTAATAAIVTGTALYLAKTGKLDKFATTEAGQKAVNGLKSIADKLITKAEPYINKVKPHIDEAVTKAKPHVEEAISKVQSSKLYTEGRALVENAKPIINETKTTVTAKAKEFYDIAKKFSSEQTAKIIAKIKPVTEEVVEEVVDVIN